ncbi:MAG: hypothetical protein JWM19_6610 [Actinomycetia bacterium]|nr:hypothetical protein [Actinomycetes bacterium]
MPDSPEGRAGNPANDPDGPSRAGREAGGTGGAGAGAAAGAGQPDGAAGAGAGRPVSEADGISRIKQQSTDKWQEPALAARVVDDVLRRIRDEGRVTGGPVYSGSAPVYNTYVNNAKIAGGFSVGTLGDAGKARARAEAKRVRQVARDELEFVRDVYAPPAGIADAERVFQARRLVILHGARSSGLRTAGLWLAATYAGMDQVYVLSPDRLLGALHGGELEKGTAYVIAGLDAATAARLGEFALDEIESWIADGGWLVITAASSVKLHQDLASAVDLVVEGVARPDPVAVAAGHGTYELGKMYLPMVAPPEETARLRSWLLDAEIQQWLRARPEPRLAAQAGRALARAARDNDDPLAILRELENPQAHAAEWFAAHPDSAERALMVAAAALAGSSYIAVADAAAALYDGLKGFRVRHERQDFWSKLAEEPWLEIASEVHPTPLGPLPVEVVRFRNERVQTAMLEYAWRRVDGMRLATCAWLRALGGTTSIEIMARAAATAGIVALWDFQYALDNILLGWAASKVNHEREAAALALSIPANDSRFAEAAWRLVLAWCDPDPDLAVDEELVKTAIFALGGPLSAQDPHRALAALRAVLEEDPDWEYVPYVALSLAMLALSGFGPTVLSALLDWTRRRTAPTPQERDLRFNGLCCFLVCANAYTGGPGEASRPVFLGPSGEGLASAAYLWGRALDTTSLRSWALELLRGWMALSDRRDAEDSYVLGLVRVIAGLDDLQRQRLEHHCYHWANDVRYPSKTAREALALLRQPGVGTKAIT